MRKTIVVSAVSLRKGGTLTILRNCLKYLSSLAEEGDYRVVALVHSKALACYPHIEYIEMPDIIRGWSRRLWCEYVTMHRISKQLSPVCLWLSLHDTTPYVKAERQAVYCQTSFPFLHRKWQDLFFDYKIMLFALLTRFAYRIHIKRNRYLIVQAEWLHHGFAEMFHLPEAKFIVAPPEKRKDEAFLSRKGAYACYTFLFASTPDCHKNFEAVCRATELLEQDAPLPAFKVVLTISGEENRYSRWIRKRWGHLKSLEFVGFLSREKQYEHYAAADCLIFPSRIETWGLPISEFASTGKPMLLADLPYAHETAAGSFRTVFFHPQRPDELKEQMKRLIAGDSSFLSVVLDLEIAQPVTRTWEELFGLLLQ